MVKEVEFSNTSEILADGQSYSNSHDQSLFVGELSDNGTTLDLKVRVPLLPELFAKRKLFLYFCNVDFNNRSTKYTKIHETNFDYCMRDGNTFTDAVYTIDLTPVLTIPRKLYNTAGSSELTIEIYTYEANLTTDYGTKTLSAPYTIDNNATVEYSKSTDGVYRSVMIDFEPWVDYRVYGVGDIVFNDTALAMSTIKNNTTDILVGSWVTPTDEDIIHYAHGGTNKPPMRAIITDILISRYAKYSIIKDILMSTGFKSHDDARSYVLVSLLQSLRERAKLQLLKHNPIDALYSMEMLKLNASTGTDDTKLLTYNIKYTV